MQLTVRFGTIIVITLASGGAQAATCDDPAIDFDAASAQVQTWGEAVARVRVIEGPGYCTATMVAPNLAITAGHCFDPEENNFFGANPSLQTICDGTTLQFGYENDNGVLQEDGPEYDCVEILDQSFAVLPNPGHFDVAYIRVEGDPGLAQGMRPTDVTFPFDNGEALTIIHHQLGGPKLVSTTDEHSAIEFGGEFVRHYGSTEKGSSGAAVLDSEGTVVAIHSSAFNGEDCGGGNAAYSIARYREEAHADAAFEVAGGVRWVQRPSGSAAQDNFGAALVAGDFNNDGADDLVVHRRSGVFGTSGALTLFFGVAGEGLDLDGSVDIFQTGGSLSESGDLFGSVLAVGDFDGDGFDDLAAGSPDEDWGSIDSAGHVVVYRGSSIGLVPWGAQGFWPARWGEASEVGGRFGTAIAAGDFNCDGTDDLAIGAPGEGDALGRVYIALSGFSGQLVPHTTFNGQELGTAQGPGPHWFGYALAAGHLVSAPAAYSWACEDLAVGAPLDTVAGNLGAGSVSVVYGNSAGLTWPGATARVSPEPAVFAMFGSEVAVGSLFESAWDSLAVGSPLHGGVASGVGRVDLFRGGWSMTQSLQQVDETWADEPVSPASWDNFGEVMTLVASHGAGERGQLVVGAPRYNQPGASDGGFAMAVHGEGASGVGGTPLVDPHGWSLSAGDRFGGAMTAGDFDGDGFEELAVAVPSADVLGTANAGAVLIRHVRL